MMRGSMPRDATMKEICNAIEAGGLNALLQTKPHLLKQADALGDLPLHAACSVRYQISFSALHTSTTIETLAKHYPQALATPNAHGMLPLHLACWFQEPALVRKLIELYPPSLTMPDENGYLPISFCIGKLAMSSSSAAHDDDWEGEVKELFEYLLREAPGSLWQVDKQGVLPLQYANLDSPTGAGQRLLQLYQQVTAQEGGMKKKLTTISDSDDNNPRTPIHIAICSNTRLDIINHIHKQDPQAILVPDHRGGTPLHQFLSNEYHPQHKIYCRNKLDWLLQLDDDGTSVSRILITKQDQEGRTPLHCLLENQYLFYQADSDNDDDEDKNGNRLGSDGIPPALSFLSTILSGTYESPKTRQVDRSQWIQLATSMILQASSSSFFTSHREEKNNVCAMADQHGNLPLHLAVKHHSQEGGAGCPTTTTTTTTSSSSSSSSYGGLIESLLKQYPQAILIPNQQSQTVLDLATDPQNSCSLNTLYTLMNHDPYQVLQEL